MKKEKMIINITCPNCDFSKKVPSEKIPEGIKLVKCPRCSNTFELPPMGASDTESQQDLNSEITDRERIHRSAISADEGPDFFTVLWQAFKGVLFSPAEFFAEKRREPGIGQSFAFGLLLGSLGAMFDIFWASILGSPVINFILKMFPEFPNLNYLSDNHFSSMDLIFIVFYVLIFMFIASAVLHACLFIIGGAKSGFSGTFKVFAYSNATSIFSLIPFVGGFIGWIWGLVIMVIGLSEIHETSTVRAVFALLIPVFLLIILGIILGFIAFFIFSSQII